MEILIIGITSCAGIAIFMLVRYLHGNKSSTGKKILSEMITLTENNQIADSREIDQLIQNLKSKCMHDETIVSRLVESEQELNPTASKADWIRSAIARWERDNR